MDRPTPSLGSEKQRWGWRLGGFGYQQVHHRSKENVNANSYMMDRWRPENRREPVLSSEQDGNRKRTKGVLLCAWGATTVLIVNIILTIIAAARAYSTYEGQSFGSAILYQGSCSRSKNWATGLHFVINILSTLVLAASNYSMQSLNAPSRQEVDNAHSRGKWLDIGTPSWRNLRVAGKRRRILWSLLLASSLPIHLIYNSAVFHSIGTNLYSVVLASADFDYSNLAGHTVDYEDCFVPTLGMKMTDFYTQLSEKKIEKLTKEQCIDLYAVDYLAGRGTLVLVTEDAVASNDSFQFVETTIPAEYPYSPVENYQWMSGRRGRNKEALLAAVDSWAVSTTRWSAPEFKFITEIGTFSQTTCTYADSDGTMDFGRCDSAESWDTYECSDFSTLSKYACQLPPENALREYLNNESHWYDSSWATNMEIERIGQRCGDNATSMTYGETGKYVNPLVSTGTYTIDHCLSQTVDDRCQLIFSLPICLIVIICNMIKVGCMFLAANEDRKEIFLTIGDAMSSFLKKPDPTSAHRCYLSRSSVNGSPDSRHRGGSIPYDPAEHASPLITPRILPGRRMWMQAVSVGRWTLAILWFVIIIIVTAIFLSIAIDGLRNNRVPYDLDALWKIGFGTPTTSSLVAFPTDGTTVAQALIVANTPQLILSIAYFFYNSLLTSMLLTAEYESYARNRNPLRVSWPEGIQRSTYYLTLPYWYSVPLLIASAFLHWLVSQSIFYTEIRTFDIQGQMDPSGRTITCGFSPIAVIFALGLGIVMIVFVLGLGMIPFRSRMPLAGNCSVAISAACHPLVVPEDEDHSLKPIMWGEVRLPEVNSSATPPINFNGRGTSFENVSFSGLSNPDTKATEGLYQDLDEVEYPHCSFTSGEVVEPDPHKLYA
ncbi:hypothetical protein FQN53_009405 [Emmonsiellopsis sp. PD_33]|nr:hypothetical protein FQN53_009405 [Emmonsiellopsis sp. PD_33]